MTTTNGANQIICCEERLMTWWQRSADGRYTYGSQSTARANPNVITREMIATINSMGMRARTSYKSWGPILEKELPELTSIPTNVDLVKAGDNQYAEARGAVEDFYIMLTQNKGITDMAAIKACWPHRPKLIAISDSYVRRLLGVPSRKSFGSTRKRFARSGVAVMDAIRGVGLRNPCAMAQLDACCNVLVHKDITASNFLSMARIIDIYLWTEEDIKRRLDGFWHAWYSNHKSTCKKSIRLNLS